MRGKKKRRGVVAVSFLQKTDPLQKMEWVCSKFYLG